MKEPVLDEKIEEKNSKSKKSSVIFMMAFVFLGLLFTVINLRTDTSTINIDRPPISPEPALNPEEQREHDSLMQRGYEALDWLDSLIEVQQDSIDNSK